MDLVSALVADEQSFELMKPGEGAFDDPADAAEAGAVFGFAAGDLGGDPALAQLAAADGEVVATIGSEALGPAARAADAAVHGRDALDEWDQLGEVVAVAARDRPGERDPGRVN